MGRSRPHGRRVRSLQYNGLDNDVERALKDAAKPGLAALPLSLHKAHSRCVDR